MYHSLPVTAVDRNPDQPRKHFDPEALAELAASITANGLLEPIIVRPHPAADDRFLIIAGERRWRAAQVAELTEVPCRVLEVDEATAFELSVAENVNRHDMTSIEEANAYATLQGYGRDVDAIAGLFGKSTAYVRRRLLLLQLVDEVAAQVEAGHISTGVATQAAHLSPANQRNALTRLMRGDFATDNEAIHYLYAVREAENQTAMFECDEPTEAERAERKATKKRVLSLVEQAERLTEVLAGLAAATPEDFAATGDASAAMVSRLERMAHQLSAARFAARQGAAIYDARATTLRLVPEAI